MRRLDKHTQKDMDTGIDEKIRVKEMMMKELAGGIDGGWSPIKDIKDPCIDVIAKFAVSEFNKQSNSSLKFQTVVSGNMQFVCGINYQLLLDVSDGDDGGSKTYEAQVCQHAVVHSKTLHYFKSIH